MQLTNRIASERPLELGETLEAPRIPQHTYSLSDDASNIPGVRDFRISEDKLNLFVMRSWKWIVLALIVAAPIAAWVANRYQTRQYVFTGSVSIKHNVAAAKYLGVLDLYLYAGLVKTPEVLALFEKSLDSQTEVSNLASRIAAKPNRSVGGFDVQLTWPNESESSELLNKFLQALVAYSISFRDANLKIFEDDLELQLDDARQDLQLHKEEWNNFSRAHSASTIETQVATLESNIQGAKNAIASAENRRSSYAKLAEELRSQYEQGQISAGEGVHEAQRGDLMLASDQQRQTQLTREIESVKERAIAQAELETAKTELERKRKLSGRGLVASSQVVALQSLVKKLELQVYDDPQTVKLRGELDQVIGRMADPNYFSAASVEAQRVKLQAIISDTQLRERIEAADVTFQRECLASYEWDLAELEGRLPQGIAIQEAVLVSSKRLEDIQNEASRIKQIKRTQGHALVVFSDARPASPPIETNQKKIFAGSFGCIAILVLIPGLCFEMYRLKQSRGTSIANRYQLPILGRLHHQLRPQTPELENIAFLLALRLDRFLATSSAVVLLADVGDRSSLDCLVEAIARASTNGCKRTLVIRSASSWSHQDNQIVALQFKNYLSGEAALEAVDAAIKDIDFSNGSCIISLDLSEKLIDWQETRRFGELLKTAKESFDLILIAGPSSSALIPFHALAGMADTIILTCLDNNEDSTADALMTDIVHFDVPVMGIVIRV